MNLFFDVGELTFVRGSVVFMGAADVADDCQNDGAGGIYESIGHQNNEYTARCGGGSAPNDENHGEDQRAGTVVHEQFYRIGKTGVQHRVIDSLKEHAEQKQQIHHFQRKEPLCSGFHTDVAQRIEKQCGGCVIDTGPGEDFPQSCQHIYDLASVDSITT